MSNFMESVKDTMLDGANNISVTENGAVGLKGLINKIYFHYFFQSHSISK